jgi:hypothetical protein
MSPAALCGHRRRRRAAHQEPVTGQQQVGLDLLGAFVAGTAEQGPQVRPLDRAVEVM